MSYQNFVDFQAPVISASWLNHVDKATIDVRTFGTVGDGAEDDTTAIQAAIDFISALGGGTVYFPPGTYIVTATLTVHEATVHLEGAGAGATTLAINHMAGPGIDIRWYFSGVSRMTVLGWGARNTGTDTISTGIAFPYDATITRHGYGNYVRDCIIQNHPSHGVYTEVAAFEVLNTRILNVNGHGFVGDTIDSGNVRFGYTLLRNVQIYYTAGHSIALGETDWAYRVTIDNCDLSYNATNAAFRLGPYNIYANCQNLEVRQCGIGGYTTDEDVHVLEGIYCAERSPHIENNRFLSVLNHCVVLAANAHGARVIDNHITGPTPAALDPAVSVTSGCLGVYVRWGYPAWVTTAMTPAPINTGNRAEVYDISPQGFRSALNYFTVADDAVHTFTFTGLTEGVLVLSGNSATARCMMIGFRVGDGNAYCDLLTTATGVATTTGVLAGTTGTDGDLTISAGTASATLYIENRRGASSNYMPTFLSLQVGELVI